VSYAFLCEVCDGPPKWRITRIGDVVVSWACAEHFSEVCDRLQRDWEVTRLSVELCSKLREVAEINTRLREIVEEQS
jgi:hypothetical protein